MDTEAHRKTMDIAHPSDSQPVLDANPNFPSLNWGDPKPLITEPISIMRGGKGTPCSSPLATSPMSLGIPIPSPIITKRTRTNSTYDRAMENPIERGCIKYFSRGKGHGFIVSEREVQDEVFVHISDIEGEYVPREGDEVTYRLCPIPPKLEKFQAIHVRIVNFTPDVHMRWDSPLREEEKNE